MIVLDATIPNESGPESDGNEGVFCILKISSVTEASPFDCLESYLGYSWEEFYPSAEKQSVYSAATADEANILLKSRMSIETWIRWLRHYRRFDKTFQVPQLPISCV